MRIFNTSGPCDPDKHYTVMREALAEGYYVVFSNKHADTDALFFDETINGKRIYTYIIRTDFDRPSGQ